MYKSPIINCIALLMISALCFTGCDSKTKSVEQKTTVVSKKIAGEPKQKPENKSESLAQKNVETKKLDPEKEEKLGASDKDVGSQKDLSNSHDPVKGSNLAQAVSQNKNGAATEPADIEMIDSVTSEDKSVDEEKQRAAELLASLHQEANQYNSERESSLDKLSNPFLPLFSDTPAPPKEKSKKPKKPEYERTPIEKVDLSQLKLVATLRAKSGNKALVEDSTGKGYVVNLGTLIGINSGSIVKITNDSLVVEEEIETLTGDVKIQRREIKLQKAPGE